MRTKTRQLKDEWYNRYARDKAAKKFYTSRTWANVRHMKLRANPLCETCLQNGRTVQAEMVHHIIPVSARSDKNLDVRFLQSLCLSCHNTLESEIEADAKKDCKFK